MAHPSASFRPNRNQFPSVRESWEPWRYLLQEDKYVRSFNLFLHPSEEGESFRSDVRNKEKVLAKGPQCSISLLKTQNGEHGST